MLIESILSLNLYLLYVLINIDDDDTQCEIVDCTTDIAVEMCPRTCSEPEICKTVDCNKPKSWQICPRTCPRSPKVDTGIIKLVKVMITLHIGIDKHNFIYVSIISNFHIQ